jgi:hypothetical protein
MWVERAPGVPLDGTDVPDNELGSTNQERRGFEGHGVLAEVL